MNYISGLFNVIFGVGAILVGGFGLLQYFGGSEKDLERIEKLKNEGQITIAEIDTMILEITIKRMKTYSLGYSFVVDGKTYDDKYHFRDYNELDSLTGLVTYLPSDPTSSSLNIDSELAKARNEVAENESSSFGLWLGIGLLLFGLFQLFRAYRKFTAKQTSTGPPPIPVHANKNPHNSDFV